MEKSRHTWVAAAVLIGLAASATTASASTFIRVDFEANFESTGTGFAPLAGVFHDGSFSAFTPGALASDGLESLAEIGNPSAFLAETLANVPTANVGNTDGQIGGSNRPLSRSFTVAVDDANTQFSFASMFLPSNDWFVSNQGGGSLDVSSLLGARFGESLTIDLQTIYDAGTELEDFTRGGGTGPDPFGLAPRLSDANGGDPNDQNDPVSLVARTADANLFEDFVNPNGVDISRFLGASSGSLGTVTLTVVPEPGAVSLMALGLSAFAARRRR